MRRRSGRGAQRRPRVTIISRLFRPENGAAAYRLGALADTLRDRGYAVTVLTTRPPAGLTAEDDGIDVRRWPVLRDKGGNVRGYIQYLSYDLPLFLRLLFSRTDLVVIEPPTTTGIVGRVACWLRRWPYVHFSADVFSTAAEGIGVNRLVVRLLRLMERWVLLGSAGIIAVSEGVRVELHSMGVPDDVITVVGVGVDTERFAYRPAENAQTLVYGGTMSEIHGAEVFVRAFAQVSSAFPQARLVMIGQGVDGAMLRTLAAELAPGHVDFLPPQPPEVLSREFSSAAAALASIRPGVGYDFAFATKALAGLSAGARVIYAGVGPVGGLIEENDLGWAVGWDVDEVVAAMTQALSTPPTDAERRRAAAWVREHHSLNAVAATSVGVIEQAWSARHPGARRSDQS